MNKINFKVLISVLLVSFVFIACGGDEHKDEVTKTNHFLYEEKEYDMDCTLANGKKATGYYKGGIEVVK